MQRLPVCMSNHRPVEMRCHRNGVILDLHSGGEPYLRLAGDTYRCPECGATFLTGFGRPASPHDGDESYSSMGPRPGREVVRLDV